ncbi:MAG: hypothetical protein H7263_05750 [Candidatus Sericytochromatia bacterium]|nr:hypothetical protein [Candidatus Sericytochromatia bacterium]
MSLSVTNNQKIEIISDLSTYLPYIFDEILFNVQEICLKSEENFNKLEKEMQTEIVTNTIFDLNDSLYQDLEIIIEINKYINHRKDNDTIKQFIEENRLISNHHFFNSDKITNRVLDDSFKLELETFHSSIMSFFNKIIHEQSKINFQLNKSRYYLSKLFFIEKFNQIEKLKIELDKNIHELIESEKYLSEMYVIRSQNIKDIEHEILLIKTNYEKNTLISKVDEFTENFSNILTEQEILINSVKDFQLFPLENLLNLTSLINQISVLLLAYPLINNFITSIRLITQSSNETSILIDLQKKLISNFLQFYAYSEKIFTTKLENVKDKKKVAKERFLDPIKDKFNVNDFVITTKLFDLIF